MYVSSHSMKNTQQFGADSDADEGQRDECTQVPCWVHLWYVPLSSGQLLLTHLHAGIMSVFFTYPLEIIRVRMAFHTRAAHYAQHAPRPSFTRAFLQIYHEGLINPTRATETVDMAHYFNRNPLLKFYRGFTVTIVGMIPYAGVSFLCWGYLRSRFLPPSRTDHEPSTPLADLAFGALSGAVAQTASYPFEIVRRRMQVGGITRPDRWLRWGETVKAIWQARGWRGFYVGLSIGYIKVIPMTAVSFAVWQGGKRLLDV